MVLAASMLLGGCTAARSAGSARAATDPTTTARRTTPESGPPASVVTVTGFPQAPFVVRSEAGKEWSLCLWLAATWTLQERGLMQVTDRTLGGADGMAFRFDHPTSGRFWMRNTPMPLSIAFFAADGRFVGSNDMEPCGDDASCPAYAPPREKYVVAVEVPRGELAARGMASGSTLREGGDGCHE